MNFTSALLTYGIILICFVAVATIAVFLGMALRKRKDKQAELEAQTENKAAKN